MGIKGKIFSSGSFDSSVNDVHGTKRFNIGGFGERKERACKVRRDIIYPQKARNSQGDYLFIVNQDTFRQAVEVEQCVDEGSECLTDPTLLPAVQPFVGRSSPLTDYTPRLGTEIRSTTALVFLLLVFVTSGTTLA